ncbi:zeta toxin family protein [Streptomyces sp. NPDC002793]|uniref:zeta toxin family protein n=1 Tax=Streptomyces sp. NPDC002793 TaxID=3154432 RepID=UPI00333341F3
MADVSAYHLTETQIRDRFEERVRGFIFDEHRTSDHPVLVMVGGQPGAGKTMAMQAAEHRHAVGDIIALTADDLRPLHPRYEDLMRDDPLLMVDATTQATSVWMQMAYEYARNPEHQYSLMMEGTFRDPAATLLDAERFAEAGVSVELVALSVRQERSRLDALHRYLPAANAQPGRWVFADRHDEAYRMVAATVEAAETSPHIQRVTVTNRSGADLYVNSRGPDGRLIAEARGAQVVEEERNRPFPPEEARGWLTRHADTLIAFAAAGEINDNSRPVLQRVAGPDADVVVAMVDSDPTSDVRRAHASRQLLLQTLVDEPLALGSALPYRLESEQGLSRRFRHLTQAEETARRISEPPAAVDGTERLAQKLTEQGTPPDVVERAQKAAREDQQYAQLNAARAATQAERLGQSRTAVTAELQRRSRLSPVERQAEDALRVHLHTALGVVHAQRSEAPVVHRRIEGPQQSVRRKGESL